MCFGSNAPDPDYTVQNQQAKLADRYEAHHTRYYKPIERELVAQARDNNYSHRMADQAGDTALAVYDASSGQSDRKLGRYGQHLTARQQQASDFKQAFNRSTVNMASRSNARNNSEQLQGKLKQGMLGLGRGVQSEGIRTLGFSGNMEAQRNSNNQQIAAQNHASGMRFLGQAAGTAATIGLMVSDKNKKKNIRKRSDKTDMQEVRSFDNYSYDYKPGEGGGRSENGHIGGMAQEMPQSISNGKAVDVGDSVMLGLGAIRNLDKRLSTIEKRVQG